MRLATLVLIRRQSRRAWPEIFEEIDSGIVIATLKEMLVPFLGFICMPLIFLINLQVYPVLIATFYGPALFAAFIASRILARAIDQFCNSAYSILFNEFSYTDLSRLPSSTVGLLGAATVVMGVVAIGALALLALFGDWIFKVWAVGKVAFSMPLVLVLGLSALARALAVPSAALLSSRNAHVKMTIIYLLASLIGISAGFGLGVANASFIWLGACVLFAESAQLVVTIWVTARLLRLPTITYVIQMIHLSPQYLNYIYELISASVFRKKKPQPPQAGA